MATRIKQTDQNELSYPPLLAPLTDPEHAVSNEALDILRAEGVRIFV